MIPTHIECKLTISLIHGIQWVITMVKSRTFHFSSDLSTKNEREFYVLSE